MSARAATEVYGLRWRVETILKAWKSHFRLTQVLRGGARALEAMIYARLIFVTVVARACGQGWLGPWQSEAPPPRSLLKVAALVAETGGIRVSARQIQRVLQRVGSAAQAWQEREGALGPPTLPSPRNEGVIKSGWSGRWGPRSRAGRESGDTLCSGPINPCRRHPCHRRARSDAPHPGGAGRAGRCASPTFNHTRGTSATMLQVAVSRAFFYTASDMVKTILLSIIIFAVPVFFVALLLSSAYHRIVELRRRCHATAQRVRLAIEERDAGLREIGGGDIPTRELKDAAEHLLQEPTHPAIAELVLRAVQADRQGLEQVLETTRLPSGRTAALETLYATHTELELAARQSVEAAQAFEKTSRRLPGLLFASAGRSH